VEPKQGSPTNIAMELDKASQHLSNFLHFPRRVALDWVCCCRSYQSCTRDMDTHFPRRGNSGLQEQVKPTDTFELGVETVMPVSTCRVSQSWSAGRWDFPLQVLCIKPKSHYRQIQSRPVPIL